MVWGWAPSCLGVLGLLAVLRKGRGLFSSSPFTKGPGDFGV